jgi:aspartate oxidase
MSLYSLTRLVLAPSACFSRFPNLCKVLLKVAGSLCNNPIPIVPGKRYSIP